ncbi:MAG TPA: DUF5309 family protein [Gemmatimonadaceae bacterium]
MSAVSGLGTTFNLPNYHGDLIELTPYDTPLLSAAGGITGGGAVSDTTIEWQTYDLRDAAVRTRLEGADAPTTEERARANVTNRTQIFHEAVSTSYTKQAATEQYASANGGAANPVQNEHAWQVVQALKQVARDVNYSFWNAQRVDPANNSTARQMAGLLSVMSSNAQVKAEALYVDASAATDTITKTHNLVVNDKVVFTDVGASTTIVPNRAYWVTSISTTASFKVSATQGGTAITVGTATVSFYGMKAASILTTDDVNVLLQSVFDNGGITEQGTATLFVPSGQKRMLTKAYATSGTAANQLAGTRNVGGLNLETIITDFGVLNIAVDRNLPADALTVVSLDQIQPVFTNIPNKGVLFEEELAKTGSSDKTQIYGEIGLKYGNEASHGVIRGLFA